MTKAIAIYFSNFIVHKGICTKEKEKVLCYGFELLVTSIIGVLLMVLVSIIMKEPISWLLFLIGFAPLRTTAGGYHASTHWGCYIISTLMYAICLLISIHININSTALILMALISVCVVFALSPVEAVNKPLNKETKEINRRNSLSIILFEFLVIIFICFLGWVNKAAEMFCLGIFAAVLSLGVTHIKNIFVGGNGND